MAGKYQAYPEYKKSSIGLLGEIPSKWEVLRYKNVLKVMQGMAFKSSEYVDTSSVVNIRMGNIKKGGNIDLKHNTKYLPEDYKGLYGAYELYEGDAIIAMTDMSPTLDFLAVPAILKGLDEKTSYLLNQRVGKLLLDKEFDIRFIRYLLLSDELRTQLKAKGLGTVQANMSNDDLYCSYFFCPSSKERLKIVDFLDHETAKIDTLIEKQQQLIKLLKEKRQAVISHAVTKGLNPNAPMRDSGVEWLGEVPEHWDVLPLKYAVTFQRGHDLPAQDRVAGDVPLVSSAGISSSHNVPAAKAPGLVTGRYGTIGKFNLIDEDYWPLNTTLYSINLRGNKPKFLWYMLHNLAPIFIANSLKSAVPGVDRNDLHMVKVVITKAHDEQDAVCDYLDQISERYDALIKKAEGLIKLMQERRTALISAAVTGKIDLRNWQAPAPSSTNNKEDAA